MGYKEGISKKGRSQGRLLHEQDTATRLWTRVRCGSSVNSVVVWKAQGRGRQEWSTEKTTRAVVQRWVGPNSKRKERTPWVVCRPRHLKLIWKMGSDWTEGIGMWMVHGIGRGCRIRGPESPAFKTNNYFYSKSKSFWGTVFSEKYSQGLNSMCLPPILTLPFRWHRL